MDFNEELRQLRDRARELGYVVAAPYEKVIHEGEGVSEEYQLIPTRQIETYQDAIRLLKNERSLF